MPRSLAESMHIQLTDPQHAHQYVLVSPAWLNSIDAFCPPLADLCKSMIMENTKAAQFSGAEPLPRYFLVILQVGHCVSWMLYCAMLPCMLRLLHSLKQARFRQGLKEMKHIRALAVVDLTVGGLSCAVCSGHSCREAEKGASSRIPKPWLQLPAHCCLTRAGLLCSVWKLR